jgi:hypothetical protein
MNTAPFAGYNPPLKGPNTRSTRGPGSEQPGHAMADRVVQVMPAKAAHVHVMILALVMKP